MLSIRKYGWFLTVGILLTACKTVDIPDAYNFRVKEVQNNPYGCWTKISLDSIFVSDGIYQINGELLAMGPDTSILLVADGAIKKVPNNSIKYAELYTHKNQAGTYMGVTGLYLIPNIIGTVAYLNNYGDAFLLIGLPVAVTGIIRSIIEATSNKNILAYPEKSTLDQFILFARYPAGMPQSINLTKLTLKKSTE